MANVTLAIPDETYTKMKMHTEIRWSDVARQAIEQKLEDLEILNKITAKSKITEKDVMKIAKRVDRAVAKKLGLR